MNSKLLVGAIGLLFGGLLGGMAILVTHTPVAQPPLGAVTGPDQFSPDGCFSYNGAVTCHTRAKFTSATTTPLTIKTPAATSTLSVGSGCNLTLASTTAKAVRFYKAAVPNATTTLLFGANIAGNASGAVVASTSNDNFVFAPSTYLNMDEIGGTGVDSPTGVCNVSFRSLI